MENGHIAVPTTTASSSSSSSSPPSSSSVPTKKKKKTSSQSSPIESSFILRLILFLSVVSFTTTLVLLFHLEQHSTSSTATSLSNFVENRISNLINENHGGSTSHSVTPPERKDINKITNIKNAISQKSVSYDANNEKKQETIPQIKNQDNPIDKKDDNHNNHNQSNDKEKIIQILQKSGLEMTPDILEKLPSWEDVTSLYGPKPKIIGLESCPKFQSTVPETDAYIGGSGMFNTGTNLLADLLLKYCTLPKREVTKQQIQSFHAANRMKTGMLWHVPWGKHNPISWRTHHKATVGGNGVEQTHVLPIVVIKDPFHWMSSMCRHPYAAQWRHTKINCPHLVIDRQILNETTGTTTTMSIGNQVKVPYRQNKAGTYDSLVGLWNDWYGDYYAAGKDFPRLIIRYEDLLFHLEEVMTQICDCGGGTIINTEKNGFVLNDANAKAEHNNGSNGLLGAMLRYGNDEKRTEIFSKQDVDFAKKTLRKDLMDLFSYSYPSDKN